MLKKIKNLGKLRKEFGDYKNYVFVSCTCGVEKIMREESFKRSKSCGCKAKEVSKKRMTTHGLSRHPIYSIWKGMVSRCNNQKLKEYVYYGGRGIKVCDRWKGKDGFQNFLEDMGERPSLLHQIDRIDNNKGYSPSNCRWATSRQQMNNTRRNRIIEYDGKKKSLTEWAKELSINYASLHKRIKKYGVNKVSMKHGKYNYKHEAEDTMKAMEADYKMLLGVG